MASRFFESKAHAIIYSKYRPIPPKPLIQKIISFLQEKYTGELNIAVDVGCGSGQSTTFLSPYFKKVIGTDISKAQIEKAIENNQLDNVEYLVSPAETIPCKDVQLIAASQAAHWFDLPKFYEEGRRALCKDGVLAMFGYVFPKFICSQDAKNPLLDEALDKLYREDLKGYWADDRKKVDDRYKDFVIPYKDFIRHDEFYHDSETRVSDLLGYCETWSGYQNYCKTNGEEKGSKLIDKFQKRIIEILDVNAPPEEIILTKRTSFFLLMARN